MAINPMHFTVYDGEQYVDACDSTITIKGSTNPDLTTCPRCKESFVWKHANTIRGTEPMPKDPKITVDDLRRTANELLARAAEIEREAKAKELPEEPPMGAGTTFKLIVQFRGGTHLYTYLLVRKPGMRGGPWWTTGTGDTGYFPNWAALIEWLRSDNVAGHSALIRMIEGVPDKGLPNKGKVRYPLGGKQR